MDDMVEHLGKGLLAFFRVIVALAWAAIEFAYEKLLWWLGWPVMRMLTLGKYPKEGFFDGDYAPLLTQLFVGLAGLALPILVVYWLAQSYG